MPVDTNKMIDIVRVPTRYILDLTSFFIIYVYLYFILLCFFCWARIYYWGLGPTSSASIRLS